MEVFWWDTALCLCDERDCKLSGPTVDPHFGRVGKQKIENTGPADHQVFTHLKKQSQGKTGLRVYPDGMVETDGHVGELLKLLDDLKVADNTVFVYTTDNGAECATWPDGGATPFKGGKDTNWEGGFRVPRKGTNCGAGFVPARQ